MITARTIALLALSAAVPVYAAPVAPASRETAMRETLQKMPVREVTVFKDGHALVIHEGRIPTSEGGAVRLDYVPTPVLGTFWPYVNQKNARLQAVVSSRRRVPTTRAALNLRELLEANVGAQARITEVPPGEKYDAVILAVPKPEEAIEPNPAIPAPAAPGGNLILLRTPQGTRALDIDRIQDVTFPQEANPISKGEEWRNLLTLRLDWQGGKPDATAEAGLMYLQKGLRWIPSYKVTIDGKGGARVELQATLINEMVDLENVTANLVIGAPNFESKEMLDPIGLQQTLANLSPYFETGSRTGGAFAGNAFMTQAAAPVYMDRSERSSPNTGPEVVDAGKNEDLFVFTVKNLSLKKGERLVAPVTEYRIDYRDVYTLNLPVAPPREIAQNYNTEQQAELARLLAAPRVLHKIRLKNTAKQPLTTAPALILRGDQVLGQGTMTYAAPGVEADLTLNPAVDIAVKKEEKETARTPNALTMQDYRYARVDLSGKLTLTNHKQESVALEVTRYVVGTVTSADDNGAVEQVNPSDDSGAWGLGLSNRYSWPGWWGQANGVGKVVWKLNLPAGKSVDLDYQWHYFWR